MKIDFEQLLKHILRVFSSLGGVGCLDHSGSQHTTKHHIMFTPLELHFRPSIQIAIDDGFHNTRAQSSSKPTFKAKLKFASAKEFLPG